MTIITVYDHRSLYARTSSDPKWPAFLCFESNSQYSLNSGVQIHDKSAKMSSVMYLMWQQAEGKHYDKYATTLKRRKLSQQL